MKSKFIAADRKRNPRTMAAYSQAQYGARRVRLEDSLEYERMRKEAYEMQEELARCLRKEEPPSEST